MAHQQIVVPDIDAYGTCEALVDGVARTGEENGLARFNQHSEAHLQGTVHPRRQKDILNVCKFEQFQLSVAGRVGRYFHRDSANLYLCKGCTALTLYDSSDLSE